MTKVGINELIFAIGDSNYLWILIPIFFIGIITDKYQEEFGTSIGNSISNGALIIFSGFSWIQIISSRENFALDVTISQYLLSVMIIVYGFSIIASGFKTGRFAKKYGRIRVVTFMLMFFSLIIYVPIFYNFVSVLLFVFLFPFYYAFITEFVKVMPNAGRKKNPESYYAKLKTFNSVKSSESLRALFQRKTKEYLQ